MIYGYARVSTPEQNTNCQWDALMAVGCDEIVTDNVSGVAQKRPRLDTLLKRLKKGDTFTETFAVKMILSIDKAKMHAKAQFTYCK